MINIFKPDDDWGEDVETKSHFASKNQKKKKEKDKHADIANSSEPGKYVRAPQTEVSPVKKNKKHKVKEGFVAKKEVTVLKSSGNISGNLNSTVVESKNKLSEKLRTTLKGGHFRFLNEQLYSIDGKTAYKLFTKNPDEFKAYHEGYRHQIEQWPQNPLNRIINYIRKMPKHLVIADFGCGDGRLARSIPNEVRSIDLVALTPNIIACDMANTPLESKSIDIAVYCLSLMGTNIQDFILEANRILKIGAIMYIAEIVSRFENTSVFTSKVESMGFKLQKKDTSSDLFIFFIFKKMKNIPKGETNVEISLKPCLYKKR